MPQSGKKGFLAQHGAALIDAGYDIVPIKRGEKRPPFTGWENLRADREQLADWIDGGYGTCGVGIITGQVVAIDIDIQDERIAKEIEDWCHFNVGMAPVRVGLPPKRLLVYRTESEFPKVTSKSFDNPALPDNSKGKRTRNRIEVLARGQQFVAYAIHPDTGRPYQWLHGQELLDVAFDDLPVITHEQAQEVARVYEQMAAEAGWPQISTSTLKAPNGALVRMDVDDPFAADTQIADISEEDLHAKLLLVPGADDYDTWLQIGMALYHQFDGGDRGLELWHEWSSEADNYDPDALDGKWKTFDIGEKGRAPVTARLIIKLAKEHEEKLATEVVAELNRELTDARTMADLKAVGEKIKKTEIDKLAREQFVGRFRQRFEVITGQKMGIASAREALRYERTVTPDLPRWLENWVYMSDEDKFYNTKSRLMMTQTAFNSNFARFMLTKQDVLEGRAYPERLPAHVALNIHQIPLVAGRRYMPELDELFTINGVRYANLYSDIGVPEVPDELSRRDRRNVEIVRNHFAHLFTNERDRELFIDWLAYIVQNPGKHPNWAVLMQGTEQDGKTFFGMMMGAVLGENNLVIVDPKSLEENYNSFAEGHQLAFIEEVRLHGHNRYDVLNRVKPLITNTAISIRRMRTDTYNVPNKTAYLLATNFRDALPIDDNDSRYFVLFSRFQTKAALRAFRAENPSYYHDLYAAIEDSPGAIRGWLMNREFGPEFDPKGRAPASSAHGYMAMMARPPEHELIDEILTNSLELDLSRTLLDTTRLTEVMFDSEGDEIPKTNSLRKILNTMGFTYIGRVKVNGRPRRYWTTEPERFLKNGQPDTDAIREWVNSDL